MAKVLGVGGVFFKSPSPRKLARWYSRCLGMSLAFPTGAVFSAAKMPQGSQTVWSAFPSSTGHFKPSKSQFMINFIVDDVEAALEQVVAGGGKAVGKVLEHAYGRFGWFLDLDGNKVELWQPGNPKQAKRKRR